MIQLHGFDELNVPEVKRSMRPYAAPDDASCNYCIAKGKKKVELQDYCEWCNDSRRNPIPVAEVMRGNRYFI